MSARPAVPIDPYVHLFFAMLRQAHADAVQAVSSDRRSGSRKPPDFEAEPENIVRFLRSDLAVLLEDTLPVEHYTERIEALCTKRTRQGTLGL